ncbi:MAG: arylsulfatase [Bacteroidales bacterium]|nr:arylsulfatase [Bacteroidales bacterium]
MNCQGKTVQSKLEKKPNIVVIMVDDMGYSDIGCYGGEIPTPHIDKLAENGLRFTQFYNTARCCPTRASLMTGLYPHQTGIGHMTNSPKGDQYSSWGTEGYIGYLNRNCVTVAEVLKESGYHTYMAGKWHLGYHQQDRWPMQRGFEKFYGTIAGATSFFKPQGKRPVTLMNEHQPAPDSGYYTTDAFTDYAIRFIEEQEDENPFFLYLAYTAPHWPLHAKEEDIKKFVGKYMHGWDKVREDRLAKQNKLGLWEHDIPLSPRDKRVRPWSEVDDQQKVRSDYRMAVYAAMVHCMDYNVGRVVELLEQRGELDNTLILFLSDNGGCAEMYHEFGSKPDSMINNPNYSGAVSYGIGWANASNTPFHEYKVKTYEGGISTPFIAHWPNEMKGQAGKITHHSNYLIDVMPTLLEVSGAEYPETFHGGKVIHSLEGQSMMPTFKGQTIDEHEYMFWEHQNNCAIRYGDRKAVKRLSDKEWELYDLSSDRAEQFNLADQHSELVKHLNDKWKEWAHSHKVFPKKVKQ